MKRAADHCVTLLHDLEVGAEPQRRGHRESEGVQAAGARPCVHRLPPDLGRPEPQSPDNGDDVRYGLTDSEKAAEDRDPGAHAPATADARAGAETGQTTGGEISRPDSRRRDQESRSYGGESPSVAASGHGRLSVSPSTPAIG